MPARGRAAISRRARRQPVNVFEAVVAHVQALQAQRKKVVIALWSEGSRDRMGSMLRDHKLPTSPASTAGARCRRRRATRRMLACSAWKPASRPTTSPSSASRTFSATAWCGRASAAPQARQFHLRGHEPRRRRSRRPCRARHRPLRRLQTIEAPARRTTASSCTMPATTKLFLPVENIELLSRYGSEDTPMSSSTGSAASAGRRARRAEEAHPRDRRRADQDRRRAASARGAKFEMPVRGASTTSSARASPMRRPRTSSARSTRRAEGPRRGQADGPADLRRRRLRQDRGGAARRLRAAMTASRSRSSCRPRCWRASTQDLHRALPRLSGQVAQASRLVPPGAEAGQEGLADGTVDIVIGTHALLGKASSSRISAC
jgi:transcription-repair coupling factor (superfamily II helicase)